MSLLTAEQLAQMIENGKEPDADHVPVVYLELKPEGTRNFKWLLTHIDQNHPNVAHGIVDLGQGKPRQSTVFLRQLEQVDERYDFAVERNDAFEPLYPISVYLNAAQRHKQITIDPSALVMSKALLDFKSNHTPVFQPPKNDGPAFLMY